MRRRDFLATAAAAPLAAAYQDRKPNIILILADDLGIGGLSCYGADKFRTPQIDALAKGGIRYTHAYASPLCGPTRALLMTGRYAFRTGATNQDATGQMKPAEETMIPKVLKTAGYATVSIGKWGQLPLGPLDWGFDEAFQFKGSGTYWNSQANGQSYKRNGETRTVRDGEYIPDSMHEFLVDFMTRHRNQPFFAYYSLSHIHGEILRTPDSTANSDHYTDNINYMDKLVGKLTAALDRLKLREQTVVIFVGDNGTAENFADRSTIGGRRLSGQKGSMLEGGALVPLIVNWQGKAPGRQVASNPVDVSDFLPTFAELAGAQLPASRVMDGKSMAPQWRGGKAQHREWAFVQLARQWYVRDEKYKLNQAGQLFDMSEAPFTEKLLEKDDAPAAAARRKLQGALDGLNPGGGILDTGDGSGRHAGRQARKKKKQ